MPVCGPKMCDALTGLVKGGKQSPAGQRKRPARPSYSKEHATQDRLWLPLEDSEMARRFPPPWTAEEISGGYVVRDANRQALEHEGVQGLVRF